MPNNNRDWETLIDDSDMGRYIFREAMINYDNSSFMVIGGGIFVKNNFVYSCINCGLQYQFISVSSFIHRNKNKDGIVEENKEN